MIKNPRLWLNVAGVMLTAGAVLPFLMVIKVFGNSLTLSLFSYVASVGGLFLGMLSLAGLYGEQKREEEDPFGL